MNRTIRRIHRSPTLLIGTQLPSRLPPLWSRQASTTSDTIPRVAQPSLWQSIIPKFLRKSERSTTVAASRKRKEWNPATFYVVVYMLIGSNAINLITLRKDFTNFSRKADAQIALLQEVLERVQKGEHVDVEALLGTGDEEREQEWAKGEFAISKLVSPH